MSKHKAKLTWKRTTPDFDYETYDRSHEIIFEGGQKVGGSAAVEYKGKKEFTNPEELLAASLASCHMLTFLAIAAKSRYVVDSYQDDAVAVLEKNAEGQVVVTTVTLHPKVTFSGEHRPDAAKLQELHEKSNRHCMIENSIKSRVVV